MIDLYALLYFNLLLRQNTTSPPQNLNEWVFLIFMFVLIQGGGLAFLWTFFNNRQKDWMENQEFKRKEAEAKLARDNEEAKSNIQQDSNRDAAFVQLVEVLKSMANSQAENARGITDRNKNRAQIIALQTAQHEAMEAMVERLKAMNKDLTEGRAEIISKVSGKVDDTKADVDAHREESAEWVRHIRDDVSAVKSDLDEKATEILRRLDEKPSIKGHQEVSQQFTELLNEIKLRLAAIEARLPAAPESPKADGPALAADSKPEVKPPEVTQ